MYFIALFKDEWGFLLVVKMVELNAALKNAAELYSEDQPFVDQESGTLTRAGCEVLCRLGIGFSDSKLDSDLLGKLHSNLVAL
ncbi:TPA: hypothetical protein ACU16Q_002156 [Pasteurella multocida]|uniref:hypothetical protein n=3 Tax=Pasteurella multocida TaxID=747 RepID=UPI00189AC6DE|nr:hypothetical protein [Pasteurella multocida]MBF6983781.1 hypothetical protein [Pasteurella multocida]